MKNTIILFQTIIIGLLFTSCFDLDKKIPEQLSVEEDFIPVTINNQYEISIPKYMKKTNSLNDQAALQYQNVFKETYIAIIDEDKEEFISVFQDLGEYDSSISVAQNYRNIQLQLFSEALDITMQSESKSAKINSLDAETVEIDGFVEGINYEIAYFCTFIEGKENVYMSMAWTLKSRKKKYKATFEKMLSTFKLIDN